MENLVEIRWHGRGGQGAKTASLLLADAAFNTGKYIQGFPEYGPERMGAPITAYNRISNSPIVIHSNIYEPDYVVVVDDTLLETVDVTAGLKETGAIVINTVKDADYLKKACDILLQYRDAGNICGYVKNIGREGEAYQILSLKELRDTKVDMFTTVFIGNSRTMELNGRMVTPRGYKLL